MYSDCQSKEVFISQHSLSSTLPIPSSETVRQPFHLDADRDELVEVDLPGGWISSDDQVLQEDGTQSVAQLLHRLSQLVLINAARSVAVETLENCSPLVDVVEESAELGQVDRAAVVGVEHVDHHPAGLFAELGHVSIDERALQLVSVDVSAAILIDGMEPLGNLS